MRKLSVLTAAALTGIALGADVSFRGTLEAEYATYLDKDFVVDNRANQDLGIDMNVALDEHVSATVSFSTQSTYSSGDSLVETAQFRSRYQSTPLGEDANRWTSVNFDGIVFTWQIQRDMAFVFGDLTYSAGAFNYYFWRNTGDYAAIIRDQNLRGLGFELGGGQVYLGASDNNDKSAVLFARYPFALIDRADNKLVIAPSLDAIKGGGRDHRYTFGTELEYSRSYTELNYAARAAWGTRPFHGKNVHTFLLEPSFNYNRFTLGGTAYMAILADEDSSASVQTGAPEERLVYVEPAINLHPKFTLGLAGEWHDPDADADDDDYTVISPTGYLYPTAGMEMVFWVGYSIYHQAPNLFSLGITAKLEF